LPFGYVRSEAKKHGMGKQIEGDIKPGQRVVIVEDLVSTGKSSIQALHTLRDAGCEVLGLVSIFTYGFDAATHAFHDAKCPYYSLCDYNQLIETAVSKGIVQEHQLEVLSTWRKAPETWGR
ncbi:MAG: orotate phosphoribosyltransferase, partial [Bacteroidota bacterium]